MGDFSMAIRDNQPTHSKLLYVQHNCFHGDNINTNSHTILTAFSMVSQC